MGGSSICLTLNDFQEGGGDKKKLPLMHAVPLY